MFRELSRKNKALSQEECIEILRDETRGVLSVLGDGDYPYGMPMNHWYDAESGNIYFHCGKEGHRTDALKRHNKVSFCVLDKGKRENDHWAWKVRSVVVFGKIEIIDDIDIVSAVARSLSYKFTQDDKYIDTEIKNFAAKTLILKLIPEHICGKHIVEA